MVESKNPATKRVSVYLPVAVYGWLEEWATAEERLISSLAAFLLETAIRQHRANNSEKKEER